MKFSALALATISVLSTFTEARRTLSASAIERQLNSVDKGAFLKHARSLQDEEESSFDVTGQYSVRFNSCVSIELDEEEANERGGQNRNQNNEWYENAVAVKEMLIVDLVSSDSSIPNQEVAMDIGTFVNSVGRMVYEQVESYCTVCQEIEETCSSQQEGSTSWLAQHTSKYYDAEQGSTIEYVDCDTCALYNCLGNDDENRKLNQNDEYDMESAFDYLEELSECQAFSVNYQNSEYAEDSEGEYERNEDQDQNSQSLYVGYMCSEYGAGIQLSFFLDEDCTLATDEIDVSEKIPENSMAGQYLQMSQNLVNGIFENSFSCDNIQFASPFDNQGNSNNSSWYNFQYYGNNAEVDGEEGVPTASEYCQSIFEDENTMAIECQGMTSQVANGNWMSWMNGDGAQNETAYDEEAAQYDEDDICAAIRSTSKSAWMFRQNNNNNNNIYNNDRDDNNDNEQNTGYDYRSFGKYNEQHRVADAKSSTGTILMYIGVAAAVIAGAVYFTQKKKESNEAKKQSLILEGDAGDYKAEGEIA